VQTEQHTSRTFSYFELDAVMMLIVMTIMVMIEICVCSTTALEKSKRLLSVSSGRYEALT
jgi:hypothetical protein